MQKSQNQSVGCTKNFYLIDLNLQYCQRGGGGKFIMIEIMSTVQKKKKKKWET